MRLFVAVDVGPEVRRAAARVVDQLKQRVGRLAPHARVSWVKAERLHVTIHFIGAVDHDRVAAIRAALAAPLSPEPFDLTVATTGAFPPNRPPRVLWAGLTMGLESLQAVEREVGDRLAQVGLPGDEAPFRPHMTLARIKHAAGLRSDRLLSDLAGVIFGVVRVEAVTLFESRVTDEPTYVELQRTRLTP